MNLYNKFLYLQYIQINYNYEFIIYEEAESCRFCPVKIIRNFVITKLTQLICQLKVLSQLLLLYVYSRAKGRIITSITVIKLCII